MCSCLSVVSRIIKSFYVSSSFSIFVHIYFDLFFSSKCFDNSYLIVFFDPLMLGYRALRYPPSHRSHILLRVVPRDGWFRSSGFPEAERLYSRDTHSSFPYLRLILQSHTTAWQPTAGSVRPGELTYGAVYLRNIKWSQSIKQMRGLNQLHKDAHLVPMLPPAIDYCSASVLATNLGCCTFPTFFLCHATLELTAIFVAVANDMG